MSRFIASRLIFPSIGKAAAMGDPKLGELRGRYSLEAWGVRLGIPKVGADIEDFSVWSPELQQRCVADVKPLQNTLALLPDPMSPSRHGR